MIAWLGRDIEIAFKLLFKKSIDLSIGFHSRPHPTHNPHKNQEKPQTNITPLQQKSAKNTQMAVTFNAFLSCNLAFPFQTFLQGTQRASEIF